MCRATTTTTTAASSTAAPAANGKIQADQFKTKMCANFERTGVCPYEAKCMFAHGDADLRTREMNIADGLTTEETIKAYQRGKKNAARRAERRRQRRAQATLDENDAATWSDGDCAQSPVVPDTPSTVPCAKTPKDDAASSTGSAVAEKVTLPPLAPIKVPAAMPPSAVPIAGLNPLSLAMRRHSPFAVNPLCASAFEQPDSPALSATTALSATARSPAQHTTLTTPTVCISPLVKAMSQRYRESPSSFEVMV